MIFENDVLTFQLLDVLRLQNTCEAQVHRENRGRHFCALSFRVDTDARLTGPWLFCPPTWTISAVPPTMN